MHAAVKPSTDGLDGLGSPRYPRRQDLETKRIFRNTRGSNLALAQRDGDGAPLSLPAVNPA